MYCKFCGSSVDEDSKYCSNCGKKLILNKELEIEKCSSREDKDLQCLIDFEKKSIEDKTENVDFDSSYIIPNPNEIRDSYQKEFDATLFGFIILITNFILLIFKPFRFETEEGYNEYLHYASVLAIVIRLIAIFWVSNIAKKQRRNELVWGIFAFLVPSIALISIGLSNNLPEKIKVDNFLDDKENSEEILRRAKEYLEKKNYKQALIFAKKSIEINQSNESAREFLKFLTFEIPVYSIQNSEIQTVYRELRNGDVLKITSKNYQTIGAKVLINGKVPDDNIYEYKVGNRKISVKNGRIEQIQY